jgi:hypothetical protein
LFRRREVSFIFPERALQENENSKRSIRSVEYMQDTTIKRWGYVKGRDPLPMKNIVEDLELVPYDVDEEMAQREKQLKALLGEAIEVQGLLEQMAELVSSQQPYINSIVTDIEQTAHNLVYVKKVTRV